MLYLQFVSINKQRTFSSGGLYDEWKTYATKQMKGKDPETLTWMTNEGIPLRPIYFNDDRKVTDQEIPGKFPFTRGPYPTMYAQR